MIDHKNYTKHLDDDKVNKKNTTDQTAERLLTLKENYKKQIQNISQMLFKTNIWLFNACYYTNPPKQCSDWSTLFTLIKINWEDTLLKVWAWEFNTEVFNQKDINKNQQIHEKYRAIKWYSNTPIPLFVVDQSDSYFANDEQKQEMTDNPKDYLQENSIIVIPKAKQAYIPKKNNNINFNDINIFQESIIIKKLQTALFKSSFSNSRLKEVSNIIKKRQEKNLKEFKGTINYKNNHIKNDSKNTKDILYMDLMYLLENIVSEHWNLEQIHRLIKSFNTNKNKFE